MNDLTTQERTVSTQSNVGGVTPVDLLRHALSSGADLDRLEKLMSLQERWEANEARKAFVAAMAKFKMNPPSITKDKHVSFKTSSGKTEYDHATIGNVVSTIASHLAQFDFSHSWKTEQRDGKVVVTCIVTHAQGHSESVTLESPPDASGGKNSIQAIISAQTYLQRHSLLAATGFATMDQADDDGVTAGMLDVTLADEWIGKAKAAANLDALAKVWDAGAAAIIEADDGIAYQEFKTAVNARKAELIAANPAARVPNRPSRMAGIMAANAEQVPLSPEGAPGRDDGGPPEPPWQEAAE